MIGKDIENDILVLEWGHGDIYVAAAKTTDGIPGLVFLRGIPGEIGRIFPEMIGKKDSDCGGFLRFIFTKPESIDIIIDELQSAKSYFYLAERDKKEG
jgi:hypothetical protein